MELNIGDKVKFLNNVGGGVVTKLINKKIVHVETSDGFEIPVMISEVIKIDDADFVYGFNAEPDETQNKKKSVKQLLKQETKPEPENILPPEEPFVFKKDEIYKEYSDDINVYLAFIPEDAAKATDSNIEMYLINDSNFHLQFSLLRQIENKYENIQTGVLEPNKKNFIVNILRESLNNFAEIVLQAMFYKPIKFDLKPPVQKTIHIDATKFFNANNFKANDFFNEKAIIQTIIEKNVLLEEVENLSVEKLKKVLVEKEVVSEKINQPQTFKKNLKPEDHEMIVDLHIQELVENEKDLSPKEILDIQIGRFENELESAIESKIGRIVFIHGVGNGTLKYEIRRKLDTKYRHIKYQDASFAEYGYGATMVLLKK